MRKSFVTLALLLGAVTLAVAPSLAQEFRPANDEHPRLARPREPETASRGGRLATTATVDTFFIGHVTSGGLLPWHVGRGPYRPGVSREGMWDFEWSASDPDSLQGWVPIVRPNDRTEGEIPDTERPWMALDYGNRMNAPPVQGHTCGIVSAWHVDRGKDVPDAANAAATPLWSPLAGSASAWCGLRCADDRSYLDDASRGGTGNHINGDALLGRIRTGSYLTNANFPGYANQWDQMLYRDVRVASGGTLTVSFKYQTHLDTRLDNTESKCTGWFDKDPLNVWSGNFISSSGAGMTQPVDSFMVYVGVPSTPAATTYSDAQSRPIFDLQRRWFSEVIAIDKPYKEVLSTSGRDSVNKSSPLVLTVANSVLQPMLNTQGAGDGGGVIRVVFRVKTNKDYADETGTGSTSRSWGYGAVRIDDASITGCASPVSSGFETPAEIDNTIEGPDSQTPGPPVGEGYALISWKATGKPPATYSHSHPVFGGLVGPGNSYLLLAYGDLCGLPDSPLRGCNIHGVVVSTGDHDDNEATGGPLGSAFKETRQGILSPTINLVTPPMPGVNNCGLDEAHVNSTGDWVLLYDIYAGIFNVMQTGNVWQLGVQCYPVTQANGSKVWGPINLSPLILYTPDQTCFTGLEPLRTAGLIRTSNPSGVPDSIRVYLGREQECITWGIGTGCGSTAGGYFDNVSVAFLPSPIPALEKLTVDLWQWLNDTFPANETAGLPGTADFDTCAAHIKTGYNIAESTGDASRFDVPGDSVVVSAYNPPVPGLPYRVDMVFRILPGPGNYVVVGNATSGLRKVPSNPAAVVPGDHSFWSEYLADNGTFGSPGGHGGAWNPDAWNSARCDSSEWNIFPVEGRSPNLSGLVPESWASTYHESDSKYATLGILKNRCFLVNPAGPLNSTNITCNSVPAWVTENQATDGYDGQQQTKESTKIIPDGMLTPGSHVEYFFRMSHLATPTAFVMTPDTNLIFPQPDEGPNQDGHRWQQFGVLPDRWKDVAYGGAGSPCLLVLDYNDGRGDERSFVSLADSIGMTSEAKWGAHNGWHCDASYDAGDGTQDYTGQDVGGHGQYAATWPMGAGNIAVWKHGGNPGTTWDFYQVKGVESPGTGGAGIGSRLANRTGMGLMAGKESRQGPTKEMLRAYYKDLLLFSGDLSSSILGPVVDNGSDDVGILEDFLGYGADHEHPRGLWVMGEGFAESECPHQSPGGDPYHQTLCMDYLATSTRDPSYYAISGSIFLYLDLIPRHVISPDLHICGVPNSCGPTNDVLDVNVDVPGANTASEYQNLGGSGPYIAGVYAPSSESHPYVTEVDGFDFKNLRTRHGASTRGRLSYFADVLVNVFGSICPFSPTPVDVPQYAESPIDFAGPVWGNPMKGGGRATMHFGLASGDHVQVRVFDIAGRLVRTLADRNFEAGEHTLVWDGADDQGRALARGVYFTRVEFLGRRFLDAKKLILLR